MEKSPVTVHAALRNLADSLKDWNEVQTEQARLTRQIAGVLRRHFPAS